MTWKTLKRWVKRQGVHGRDSIETLCWDGHDLHLQARKTRMLLRADDKPTPAIQLSERQRYMQDLCLLAGHAQPCNACVVED